MHAATQTARDSGKKNRGAAHESHAGTPGLEMQQAPASSGSILKLDPIKDAIVHLVQLHRASREAAVEFSEALEGAATRSGASLSTLRRFVVARSGDKFVEKKIEVEQLAFLFEGIGE